VGRAGAVDQAADHGQRSGERRGHGAIDHRRIVAATLKAPPKKLWVTH
jgi:hypothetical protein